MGIGPCILLACILRANIYCFAFQAVMQTSGLLSHWHATFGYGTTHTPLGKCAEAYRRAVDVSPRDYRAWYGLGQTYELMKMPYFALYYFRRCVQCLSARRGVLLPNEHKSTSS